MLLADFGADVNAKDNNGVTPLHHAGKNGHVEVIKVLVTMSGADVNAKDTVTSKIVHMFAKFDININVLNNC